MAVPYIVARNGANIGVIKDGVNIVIVSAEDDVEALAAALEVVGAECASGWADAVVAPVSDIISLKASVNDASVDLVLQIAP